MHTFEWLEMNDLFFVLCDFYCFDFFDVGCLSDITGILIIPFDFIFNLLLLVVFR